MEAREGGAHQVLGRAVHGHELVAGGEHARGAEVDELVQRRAARAHALHDVARLQVPVHHLALPQVLHRRHCARASPNDRVQYSRVGGGSWSL